MENDRILVWYGRGKNLQTYEAKIIGIEENENRRDYLVHYSGWNNRLVYVSGLMHVSSVALPSSQVQRVD